MITNFRKNDIFAIEDAHERSCTFPMPNYNSPVNILQKTIIHDGKIVGSAFVHLTAEIGLILDDTLPNLTRAKLLKEVFTELVKDLERTDLEDCHVFVVPEENEQYAEFLVKHFGFERDKGISLCLIKGKNNEQSKRECGEIISTEHGNRRENSNGTNH